MSHFTVTVVVPKDEAGEDQLDRERIEQYVAKVLAPYDENGEWGVEGSHWDWWSIGGRWRWEGMAHREEQDARAHYRRVKAGEFPGSIGDKTEDEYARSAAAGVASFALVDHEGQWRERGRMGWWGVSHPNEDTDQWPQIFVDYIGSRDEKDVLVLVDCHV